MSRVLYEQADATQLRFEDGAFDVVFACLVLHHISDFNLAIKEMHRVLAFGGKLYILDIPSKEFNFIHMRKNSVDGLFTKEELVNYLRDCGFEITQSAGRKLFYLECVKR